MHIGDLTKVDGGMCDTLMADDDIQCGVPSAACMAVFSPPVFSGRRKVEFGQVKQMEKIPGTLWSSNRKNPHLITSALNFLDKGDRQIVHVENLRSLLDLFPWKNTVTTNTADSCKSFSLSLSQTVTECGRIHTQVWKRIQTNELAYWALTTQRFTE